MERELETQNVNNRYLSESYNDGAERHFRIVGSESNSPLRVSSELLKKRKQFWADFFIKYTNKSLAENETSLNDSYGSGPHKKSLSFIQHWIDTGTLPYKSMQDIDKQSEEYCMIEMPESSSSSSVDTAAYILSNMNKTNKVDVMTILEGAKCNALLNTQCQNLESIETIKLNKHDTHRTHGNENSVQDNDESNSSSMPLSETDTILIFEGSVDPKKDATQVQKHLPAHTNHIAASKSAYNKLFTQTLMHLISKSAKNDSLCTEINEFMPTYTTKENSTTTKENSMSSKENSMLSNNSTKLNQRKKLYSGRDSPVDILFTNTRSSYVIPKSTRYLHPALDSEHNISRQSKAFIRRRTRKMNMYRKSFMSNSMFSLASKNTRKRKGNIKNSSKSTALNVDGNGKGVKNQETKATFIESNNTVKEQKNHNMDSSLIISNRSEFGDSVESAIEFKKPDSTVRIFKKPKLIVGSSQVSTSDLSKHKKSGEVTMLQNLNPVVCLTKLSEMDIEKYKKSKSLIYNFKNLSNPVVHLNRLSKFDIRKYKKAGTEADKVVKNIKKSMITPTVCLTRLLERDIKAILSKTNPSELKENNSLSETTRIQKNGTCITKNTSHSQDTSNRLLQNNNIINVFEDSDSNPSTLLIHECENRNLKSASNVLLTNKLGTTDNKICKNNTMVLLDNVIDKHNNNCVRETRNAQINKKIKPNNENGCGFSFSKSNETNNSNNNNIDRTEIINDITEVSISSGKHNNRSYSDDVQIVYENIFKQARKPKRNKKDNFFILPDDSDEFIKLIPKNRPTTFRNSLHTDTSDTEDSCNTVTRSLRSQRSPMLRQSSVQYTFRDRNFRVSRKEVISQKQNNANVGKTNKRLHRNYLHFQTRFDTDSEASSCS